jgi:hypothetical protein
MGATLSHGTRSRHQGCDLRRHPFRGPTRGAGRSARRVLAERPARRIPGGIERIERGARPNRRRSTPGYSGRSRSCRARARAGRVRHPRRNPQGARLRHRARPRRDGERRALHWHRYAPAPARVHGARAGARQARGRPLRSATVPASRSEPERRSMGSRTANFVRAGVFGSRSRWSERRVPRRSGRSHPETATASRARPAIFRSARSRSRRASTASRGCFRSPARRRSRRHRSRG